MSNKVVIASLCPWPISITRPLFARTKHYAIDMVPRGSAPKTLVIEDNVQYEKPLSTMAPVGRTILAREIAADFVLHTSKQGPHMGQNDLGEEVGPPVWQCEDDGPTAEEIDYQTEKFVRYCNRVVEEADELDRRRQMGEANVPKITPRMRDCCRYLMLDRAWLSVTTQNTTKRCQFCTTAIPGAAVICPTCREKVDPEAYAAMKKPAPAAKPDFASSVR